MVEAAPTPWVALPLTTHLWKGCARFLINPYYITFREIGSLHESFVHDCLKDSLAFCKPAVAAVSGRPARTEGL